MSIFSDKEFHQEQERMVQMSPISHKKEDNYQFTNYPNHFHNQSLNQHTNKAREHDIKVDFGYDFNLYNSDEE
jgi:hypothetical protein